MPKLHKAINVSETAIKYSEQITAVEANIDVKLKRDLAAFKEMRPRLLTLMRVLANNYSLKQPLQGVVNYAAILPETYNFLTLLLNYHLFLSDLEQQKEGGKATEKREISEAHEQILSVIQALFTKYQSSTEPTLGALPKDPTAGDIFSAVVINFSIAAIYKKIEDLKPLIDSIHKSAVKILRENQIKPITEGQNEQGLLQKVQLYSARILNKHNNFVVAPAIMEAKKQFEWNKEYNHKQDPVAIKEHSTISKGAGLYTEQIKHIENRVKQKLEQEKAAYMAAHNRLLGMNDNFIKFSELDSNYNKSLHTTVNIIDRLITDTFQYLELLLQYQNYLDGLREELDEVDDQGTAAYEKVLKDILAIFDEYLKNPCPIITKFTDDPDTAMRADALALFTVNANKLLQPFRSSSNQLRDHARQLLSSYGKQITDASSLEEGPQKLTLQNVQVAASRMRTSLDAMIRDYSTLGELKIKLLAQQKAEAKKIKAEQKTNQSETPQMTQKITPDLSTGAPEIKSPRTATTTTTHTLASSLPLNLSTNTSTPHTHTTGDTPQAAGSRQAEAAEGANSTAKSQNEAEPGQLKTASAINAIAGQSQQQQQELIEPGTPNVATPAAQAQQQQQQQQQQQIIQPESPRVATATTQAPKPQQEKPISEYEEILKQKDIEIKMLQETNAEHLKSMQKDHTYWQEHSKKLTDEKYAKDAEIKKLKESTSSDRVKELEQLNKSYQETLNSRGERLLEQRKTLDRQEEEITALKSTVVKNEEQLKTLQSSLAALTTTRIKLETYLVAAREDVKHLAGEVTSERETNLVTLDAKNGEIKALQEKLAQQEASTNAQIAEIAKLQSTINEKQDQVKAFQSSLTKTMTESEEKEAELQMAKQHEKELTDQIAVYINSVKSKADEINDLQQKLTKNEQSIATQSAEITALQSTVNENKTKDQQQTEQLKTFQSNLEVKTTEVNSLSEKMAQLQAAITELETYKQEVESNKNAPQQPNPDKAAKASAMPEDQSQLIAELQKKLEEKTALAENQALRLAEVEKLDGVQQKLDGLQQQMKIQLQAAIEQQDTEKQYTECLKNEIIRLQLIINSQNKLKPQEEPQASQDPQKKSISEHSPQAKAAAAPPAKFDSDLQKKVLQQKTAIESLVKADKGDLNLQKYFENTEKKLAEAIDKSDGDGLAKLSEEMEQQIKIKTVVNSITDTLEKSNRFYTSGALVKAKEIKKAFDKIPMEDRLKLVSGDKKDASIQDFLKALLKQRAWLFKTSEAKSHSLFNKKMNEPAAKKEPEGHKPKSSS